MGSLSIWHWLIVIVVVMLLFGRGKISDLMGDVAGGIKAFKKGMAEDDTAAAKTEPPKSLEASTAPKAEPERRAESVRS
jgi:sec-independent protein translocase protein TatA